MEEMAENSRSTAQDNERDGDEVVADQWDEIVSNAAQSSDSRASSERLLTQDEIDAIIGFEELDDDRDFTRGINAFIGSGQVAYDRLPMLEVVFDRLVRMMTTSLRRFTSDSVDVSLQSISSMRMSDYLNSTYIPSMLAVIRAEEWDNMGLITVDSNLVFSMIEVLLGGARQPWSGENDARPYTSLETKLVRQMIQLIRQDIETAFQPIAPVSLEIQRLETNPRFVSIVRPANTAIVASMRVDMDTRGGFVHVVFPYATLEPIRELLRQQFLGERFGRDDLWEQHLAQELWRTEIDLTVLLGEKNVDLSSLLSLKVGDTLMMDTQAHESVLVLCEGLSAFTAKIGRNGASVAVSAEGPIKVTRNRRGSRILNGETSQSDIVNQDTEILFEPATHNL